jgi:hypothetical protein
MINNTDAVFITPDVIYVSGPGLKAIKTNTNEVLWHHDTGSSNMPIFTQDKILCRNERNSGMVYALDRATGELLWQISDIVYSSSIAHSPEKQLVYALRNNGDLLAINENTGEASIAAKFSSTPFLFIVAGTAQAYELVPQLDISCRVKIRWTNGKRKTRSPSKRRRTTETARNRFQRS